MLLLVWVTIHLFFIGHDYDRQLLEYAKIWKKIAISTLFALGLGLALGSQVSSSKNSKIYWRIIYLGFLLPMIIYFFKLLVTIYFPHLGYLVPKFLFLSADHLNSPWGIARATYVFFCLPVFALALGQIIYIIRANQFQFKSSFIYLVTIPFTFLVFYIERDRLGIVYGVLLILMAVFFGFLPMVRGRQISLKISATLLTILLTSGFIVTKSVQSNPQWQAVIADAKLAVQVDHYDAWKYNRKTSPGYPVNEMGIVASDSNYMRVAWAIVAVQLLSQNPLGFGLMSLSFGELSREKWPDAETSWSHSAWIDFALGYGLLGLSLLLGAAFLVWRNSQLLPCPWKNIGQWALPSVCLVMIAKEVSSEVNINALIFLIIFGSSIILVAQSEAHKTEFSID